MKRLLDPDSLRAQARGCAVLGAGGGGDPYLGLLQALQATEDYGRSPRGHRRVAGRFTDHALRQHRRPTVSIEKIENGDEGGRSASTWSS
jgi:DUF917 family protein